jgi:arylsulfatase A-like enzyme
MSELTRRQMTIDSRCGDRTAGHRSRACRGVLLAIAILIASLHSPRTTNAAAAPRPNILVILADDMGFSDIGCFGGEIKTPNIDALASEGIKFTQFYNGARCCPSRASLLTGLYAQQTGVGLMTGNDHLPGYTGRLNDSCVTLGDVLKSAGYQTFAVGKWHVGDFVPTTRGFDRFYGFYTGYTMNSWNPNQMALFPPGPMHTYAPGKFYATDAITDYALDFIDQGRKDAAHPWFAYVAYQAAHFPLMAPADEVAKYVPVYEKGWDEIREKRLERLKSLGVLPASTTLSPRSLIPRPDIAKRDGLDTDVNPAWASLPHDRQIDLAHRMAIYAAMVDHMDRDIGRLIEDLKSHHDLDNTVVIFLSDNGACAEWAPFGFDADVHFPTGDGTRGNGHGYNGDSFVKPILHTGADLALMGQPGGTGIGYGSAWANACNTPFRMYKHYDHEGGISTPLIVRWPGGITDRGAFRQQVGHVIDLMPTLVELSGAKYPAEFGGRSILPMEGRSLVPAFTNQPIQRDALFWEHEGNRAVRVGDLKLVSLAGLPWELYDMSKDRIEQNNLAASMPEKVKQMRTMWDDWAKRCHVYPAPGNEVKKDLKRDGIQLGD